jgi:rRNA-processing protein FCF1
MNIVNTFAGTLTAIIVIAGIIAKIKPIGRVIKQFCFRELYEANERQDKRLENLELQQLKQIICDRRLPDGERLKAGEEYIRRGGNGEVKMIYEAVMEAAKKKRLEERERFEQEQIGKRREAV